MTPDETIDLLTLAAAYDRRTVGKGDAMAWHAAVGDLAFADCRVAVIGHYTDTTDWLMPAHVRHRVQRIRARRLDRASIPPPPPELVDDWPAYQAALHAARVAAADGRDPEAASQSVANPVRLRIEAPRD
jgi:hypothetical protein